MIVTTRKEDHRSSRRINSRRDDGYNEASYVLMMHHASYGDSRMDQLMLMDMNGEEEMMITTMIDH